MFGKAKHFPLCTHIYGHWQSLQIEILYIFQVLRLGNPVYGRNWHTLCFVFIERNEMLANSNTGRTTMKSTLTIKDLALDKQLDGKAMSAVRGGQDNQANGTSQFNVLAAFAPLKVANGASFAGSGPVTIQADSYVNQTATNYSDSSNDKSAYGWFYA
jgi:hypothetical protein